MVEAICINILRDKNGFITYLRLVDNYGNIKDVTQKELIKMVKSEKLHVSNLKISQNKWVRPLYLQ